MNDDPDLERRYRRLLACYPAAFRREHEQEILSVLIAGADEGQRWPRLAEAADLLRSASFMRLRTRWRTAWAWEYRHWRVVVWATRLEIVQTGWVGLDGGCFRSPDESSTLAWRPSPMTGGRLRRRSDRGVIPCKTRQKRGGCKRLLGSLWGALTTVCISRQQNMPICRHFERRRPESNRCRRLCRPLRSHSATSPASLKPSGRDRPAKCGAGRGDLWIAWPLPTGAFARG
jgi:hypothetical protein